MAGKFKDLEDLFDMRRDEQRHGLSDVGDKEKRSWRDIDRGKDRSSHSDQSKSPAQKRWDDRFQTATAQKQINGELAALFEDRGAGELRAAILAAGDRGALQDAVQAYVEARGALPADDTEVLEKAMDVRQDKVFAKVVDAVAELLKTTDATRKKVFLLKLRSRSRTMFDRRLSTRIKEILAEHGALD